MKPRKALRAVLVVLAIATAGQAWPQGPETYATPHLYALPNATPVRVFGMGGMMSCVPDAGLSNPAFAATLEEAHARVLYSVTTFDSDLRLKGTQLTFNTPIGDGGQGVQIALFELDHEQGGFDLPGGPFQGGIGETDLSVMYGRRVSEYWLAGIGLSPVLHTSTNLYHPASGSLVVHQDSEVNYGSRAGVLYQFEPEGFASVLLDWYKEDVNMSATPVSPPFSGEFTSTTIALGVSGRLGERTLGALEWAKLKSKSGSFECSTSGLRAGIEGRAAEDLDLRIGVNDGALSFGFGYHSDGWALDYGFARDLHEAVVGDALGGSDTHQLELTWTWEG